ncbi:cleavage stimulation factor subunit 1-like isoform X2 [Eriocheir sinensis]|uniref:cleavage stimulation factor subunit 1-like isoform X2 n=1 Tax=Eriocheir sinensis TaxID=95602 RepID=UPI0021C9E34E|nr:cleavage stimulation factor subunit 1-like isoform X2 [Eriocheir sinensis]
MKEEEKKEERNKVKQRELLYKLMISQLFYDGHQNFAQELAVIVDQEATAVSPSDRLMNITTIGLQHEHEVERPLNRLEYTLGPGLDLEYETEPQTSAPEPAMYETAYVTSHKDKCRAAAFSMDGSLVATGSVDASIKILDVDRMLAKSDPDAVELHPDAVVGHPVIRTLYDHLDEITCLEFHPREQILISGSRDTNIKMFDFSKTSAKKAFKTLTDAEQVTSMSIHPSGDFLAVTTEGPVVRFYDINTCQCYVCPYPREHHAGPLTSVRYSADARVCASASKDGDIKIWDGVSGRCVQTFTKCHDGAEVCSVLYSRNGKYILSSGLDSIVKLWELSTGRCLIAYTGAGSVGHNGPVRHMVHSPCSPAFITCSDDYRARFWYRRNVH